MTSDEIRDEPSISCRGIPSTPNFSVSWPKVLSKIRPKTPKSRRNCYRQKKAVAVSITPLPNKTRSPSFMAHRLACSIEDESTMQRADTMLHQRSHRLIVASAPVLLIPMRTRFALIIPLCSLVAPVVELVLHSRKWFGKCDRPCVACCNNKRFSDTKALRKHSNLRLLLCHRGDKVQPLRHRSDIRPEVG
jgi:hypothetical protein